MKKKMISAIYGTTYKDLEKENKQLKEEIARLKEALETKYYCKYANRCNELYDCSREEYETMAQSNMKLSLKNDNLQQKIDKAIEYIKTCNDKEILESMFLNESYISNYGAKELLEILGEKENE